MGTGYTRNDTANNIADGNVINASDLDGEFDAIQAAFNASTGHSHDGTTGEGPQIGTGGIADNAVTLGTKTTGNYVATGAVSGVGLSGSASAEGATFTVSSNATDANTASTIVARDASGNFSAGTITAALTGTASNAALLDSLDSTQFLRSDAADTKTSGALVFSDNVPLHFGTGSDLRLYHSGTASYIQDYGTGNLFIQANDLRLQDDVGGHYIQGNKSSDVKIYHPADGTVHLATTSGGIDVTGTITFDGGTTSADLNFGDNDKAVFGAGSDLQIYHDGTNSIIHDFGTGFLSIKATDLYIGDSGGNTYISAIDNGVGGTVALYHNTAKKLETTATGVDVTGVITTDGMTTSADINFGDNDKAVFGAGSDLQIYHNGSASFIQDVGTGPLYIDGGATGSINLRNSGGETMAAFIGNGAAILYYDNAAKLATKTDGVDITGELQADSLDIDGAADISGVVSLHNHLSLDDSDEIRLGTSNDLLIYHDGAHSYVKDAGTGNLYLQGTNLRLGYANGEFAMLADENGSVQILHDNATKLSTNSGGVTVTGQLNADGLSLGDNETAYFGTSGDLQIYHTGSHSFIRDNGTGSLYIDATNLNFRNGAQTATYADFTNGGAARLMYAGNVKFQTTASGIDVPGDINAVNDIYIASTIYHEGDTDTYTQFHNANEWRVVTGGTEMLEVNNDTVNLGANTVGKVYVSNVSSSLTPNLEAYNSFVITLTGNITLNNPSTELTGMSGVFIFIHSGAARTVSLGSDWETAGGAGLTLSSTAGAVDIVPYYVQSSGNILLGTPQLAFA